MINAGAVGGALAIAAAIGISTEDGTDRHESNSSVDAFDMSRFTFDITPVNFTFYQTPEIFFFRAI